MTLLKMIEKLLKMYNLNLLLVEVNFINIEFDSDSDLKEENIIY
jgi:hypothetical protein